MSHKQGNLTFVNPTDRDWARHRYVLCFGAYGDTKLCVWANGIEGALDECVDWIADNAPGLLADEAVAEAYKGAIAAGKSEDEAQEEAQVDTTCAGNAGNYLHSWEWGIVAEDPGRATVLALIGGQ
jgi:hypothetical protein